MIDHLAIAVVLRLVVAAVMLVGFSYGADWMLRTENFPVHQVYFEGPFKHVTHPQLEGAILDRVRGNFFLVDLDGVRQRLEALPWVHRVSVRRSFPQDLHVQFTEQRLAARWGESAWVNTSGDVVRVSGSELPADLPRLVGPEGTAAQVLAAYQDFGATLAAHGLRLTGLTLTPRRSWRLDIEGAGAAVPLALVLDQEQTQQRLERFARVYAATLAQQAVGIKQVDLRYTNGFAVEWRNGREGGAKIAGAVAPRNEG